MTGNKTIQFLKPDKYMVENLISSSPLSPGDGKRSMKQSSRSRRSRVSDCEVVEGREEKER